MCPAAQNSGTDGQSLEARSQSHEEAVLKYLREVAWSSRKAIRLYYHADCRKTFPVDYSIPLPLFTVQPPSEGKTGLAAVREIFKNAKDVTIAEEPQGIIRITIGEVPTEILRTKIRDLTLQSQARYDPSLAIGAIASAKEMSAAMTSLGLTLSPNAGGLMAPVEKGMPCLPSAMRDVTVDQALDVIAKTWGGPVVYATCSASTGENNTRLYALWYGGAVLGQEWPHLDLGETVCLFPKPRLVGGHRIAVARRIPDPDEVLGSAFLAPVWVGANLNRARVLRVDEPAVGVLGYLLLLAEQDVRVEFALVVPEMSDPRVVVPVIDVTKLDGRDKAAPSALGVI